MTGWRPCEAWHNAATACMPTLETRPRSADLGEGKFLPSKLQSDLQIRGAHEIWLHKEMIPLPLPLHEGQDRLGGLKDLLISRWIPVLFHNFMLSLSKI